MPNFGNFKQIFYLLFKPLGPLVPLVNLPCFWLEIGKVVCFLLGACFTRIILIATKILHLTLKLQAVGIALATTQFLWNSKILCHEQVQQIIFHLII